jgi:hypothetical protein
LAEKVDQRGSVLYNWLMKAPRGGHTPMQLAYATRIMAPNGQTKKQIARSVGYSDRMADSPKCHIENKAGFHVAMAKLASESNNAALKVMHEFNARSMNSFTNKELISAVTAIAGAWEKFNSVNRPKEDAPLKENRLRAVVLKHVNNRVVDIAEGTKPKRSEDVVVTAEVADDDDPNDF